jgi:hypothetical protein
MATRQPRIPALVACYQLGEHESITVAVPLIANYPDALDEARTQAVRGISDILADTIRQGSEETT